MATSNPIGAAVAMAMADTSRVPETSGSTPKRGFEKRGVHSVPNRKSKMETRLRNELDSTASTVTSASVVTTDNAAQRNSSRSMIHSSVRVVMAGLLRPLSVQQLFDGEADG